MPNHKAVKQGPLMVLLYLQQKGDNQSENTKNYVIEFQDFICTELCIA